MKHFIYIITFMACALTANAQTYTKHLQDSIAGKGRVKVYQSDYIDTIVNNKINVDEIAKIAKEAAKKEMAANQTKTIPKVKQPTEEDAEAISTEVDTSKKVYRNAYKTSGYRVQVFSGSNSRADKTKAETIGNDIKHLFPDQPVYVHFYSPRWICRMGNFRTYEEAQDMLNLVKAAGYKQANIVKGTITVTN